MSAKIVNFDKNLMENATFHTACLRAAHKISQPSARVISDLNGQPIRLQEINKIINLMNSIKNYLTDYEELTNAKGDDSVLSKDHYVPYISTMISDYYMEVAKYKFENSNDYCFDKISDEVLKFYKSSTLAEYDFTVDVTKYVPRPS